MPRIGFTGLVEKLHAEGGGGQGETEADDDGDGRTETDEEPAGEGEDDAGDHHLGEAEAEDLAAQRPEPVDLQFEADDEQQEDDAELADRKDLLPFADQTEHWSHQDAGGEIAEHGAEADPLEQRAGDDADPEQQDDLEKNGA